MSKMKEKEMFLAYEYNHREYLTSIIRQYQQNIRYREVDVVDCLELSLAIERLQAFNEYCKVIHTVFNISERDRKE